MTEAERIAAKLTEAQSTAVKRFDYNLCYEIKGIIGLFSDWGWGKIYITLQELISMKLLEITIYAKRHGSGKYPCLWILSDLGLEVKRVLEREG